MHGKLFARGTLRQLIFVHIAKASGTALNAYLTSHYMPWQVATHVESVGFPSNLRVREGIFRKRFVSGHMVLERLLGLMPEGRHYLMTVLRDPVQQIVSHLSWVRALAEPHNRTSLRKHDESVQRIAAGLARVQLDEPEHLGRYLATLTTPDSILFDNFQTRCIVNVQNGRTVSANDSATACRLLERLDLVGLSERLPETTRLLSKHMGWRWGAPPPHRNVSPTKYGINPERAEILSALEPAIRYDRTLYERGVELFSATYRDAFPSEPEAGDRQ